MAKKAAKSSRQKAGLAQKKQTTRSRKQFVKLSSSWSLLRQTVRIIHSNWRIFLAVTGIYGVLELALVHGLGAQLNLAKLATSHDKVVNGINIFSGLLGSSGGGQDSQTASLYQIILLVFVSLALIWVLRQLQAKPKQALRAKQAYYQSTYALLPFLGVLLLIGLQMIPMLIGTAIYGTAVGNGLVLGGLEMTVWLTLFLALSIWSVYMLSASAMALYIVTLPNMTPLRAWRSAKQLVAGRRWQVVRKIVFLPCVLLLGLIAAVLPFAIWLGVLAEWVYFLAAISLVPLAHTYLYKLYKELL